MRALLLITLTCMCISLGSAQERPMQIPPVVVTGAPLPSSAIPDRLRSEEDTRRELERVPGGTALVDSREIRESRAANLQDVLDFVPGVRSELRYTHPVGVWIAPGA